MHTVHFTRAATSEALTTGPAAGVHEEVPYRDAEEVGSKNSTYT